MHTAEICFETLVRCVRERYPSLSSQSIGITYPDDEGDMCAIASELELKAALDLVTRQGDTLRLTIVAKSGPGTVSPSAFGLAAAIPAATASPVAVSPVTAHPHPQAAVLPATVQSNGMIPTESKRAAVVETQADDLAYSTTGASIPLTSPVPSSVNISAPSHAAPPQDHPVPMDVANVSASTGQESKQGVQEQQKATVQAQEAKAQEPLCPLPKAVFVSDATLPDGSTCAAGSVVQKVWEVKNVGASSWPPGVRVEYVGGTLPPTKQAQQTISLPVGAGEKTLVSMDVQCPTEAGRHTGYYRLATADGRRFGHRFWVDLVITEPAERPHAQAEVPVVDTAFDLLPEKQRYAAQLARLSGMGFKDEEGLLELLVYFKGDESQVIDLLMNPVE